MLFYFSQSFRDASIRSQYSSNSQQSLMGFLPLSPIKMTGDFEGSTERTVLGSQVTLSLLLLNTDSY